VPQREAVFANQAALKEQKDRLPFILNLNFLLKETIKLNSPRRLYFFIFLTICLNSSVLGATGDGPVRLRPALRSSNFCPFCAAINATLAEQVGKHEVSVIAKLVEVPDKVEEDALEFPKGKFEIVQVLKGDQFVAVGMSFQTQLVGTYPVGHQFLVMGVEPPEIFWSTPMQASVRLVKYLTDMQSLPAKGPDRLAFFQDFFEDPEPELAFDAYDEFAIADYADVVALKDRIKRENLVKWINDPELRVDRRRLYFTMLGVCGTEDDIRMLEKFLVSDNANDRAGLDALAAAYITLKGEAGIPLLEEHFLEKVDEENTSETNAVISALRFHGTEVDQIPRQRIAQAIRLVLKHPQLADTVIPDLARWEDWSVIEQLVDMFKNCDDDNQYIRVPVVAYLQSCPKPEAKTYLKELEAIDPDAIRRAKFFMGLGETDESENNEPEIEAEQEATDVDDGGKANASETDAKPTKDGSYPSASAETVLESHQSPVVCVSTAVASPEFSKTDDQTDSPGPEELTNGDLENSEMHSQLGGLTPKQPVAIPISDTATETSSVRGSQVVTKPANLSKKIENTAPVAMISTRDIRWLIIFIPLACSVAIFVLIWSVVNGWFERLIF
jgi:hypothetical protein